MMHDDYDDMESKFLDLAKDTPDLIQKMNASKLPAKFVYDTAKKAEKLADLENVDEWEAKKEAEIEARIRAEIEAKAKAKAEADAEKTDAIQPSLAATRAEGGNKEVITVDDPLETTFNR